MLLIIQEFAILLLHSFCVFQSTFTWNNFTFPPYTVKRFPCCLCGFFPQQWRRKKIFKGKCNYKNIVFKNNYKNAARECGMGRCYYHLIDRLKIVFLLSPCMGLFSPFPLTVFSCIWNWAMLCGNESSHFLQGKMQLTCLSQDCFCTPLTWGCGGIPRTLFGELYWNSGYCKTFWRQWSQTKKCFLDT